MFYDYHMHSSFSTDGKSTMEEMVKNLLNSVWRKFVSQTMLTMMYMLMILFQLSMKIILRV